MTETPIEALVETPTTRRAVYDHGELRFVDPVAGESAEETVKRLNGENDNGRKVKRVDGSRGKRYDVVDV